MSKRRRLISGWALIVVGGLGLALSLPVETTDDVWQQRKPPATYTALEQAAARAPSNPRLWSTLGAACLFDPLHLDYQASERHLRRALTLAPYDARLWGMLGDTLAISGKVDEAERVLRRAHELAPNHFISQWRLANALIRVGKLDEAVPYARGALRSNPGQAILMLDLGWRVSGGDRRFVEALLPPGMLGIEYQYLRLLLTYQRIEDAVARWREVLREQDADRVWTNAFLQDLLTAQAYEPAWRVWAAVPERQALGLKRTEVYDGGFRQPVAKAPIFEWRFRQNEEGVRLARDQRIEKPFEGNALQIAYDSPSPTLTHAQQLLVPPPGDYRLSYFVRSENLVTAAPPCVELTSPRRRDWRIRSAPNLRGTQPWRQVQVDFTIPPDLGAVELSIMRPADCVTPGNCPITGVVWFGGFTLEPRTRARDG
ncbi:MAG: tetratricopeptide repeat protein [Chloracidobacterium sp.]|nr:tetratricopeptide repeat protein [Chloracidobacterium sp.]MDW8216891.1 tetratricopeptide repeat protein [Acidobacteriota bacterium]